ncbi:dihydrolipoamide acetyltransferase family protein [Flavihumibacter profundi]|uniref:dihydrolipoamide acetyltransferase family protein n=1 Tax=Flavihumibacter profundi TaxID=2716883 RepID=UPI001CC74D62|nr:dihydrolipoamide acetyltransferase family protein [Flavihumibacter profundi]MBZ5855588.1 2-oxo acid dehydrogenase subunit E2 [Flavihumibacter profundi]
MIEFTMPSLGADMEAGTLCDWLVKPGDKVKRGDIIAQVDTQKGLIDIEVFDEGIVDQLLIKEDEKVPVGTVMALIRPLGEKAVPTIEKPAAVYPVAEHIRASPLAKRIAAEKNIDLSAITGTGEGGAITKEDVERAAGLKLSAAAEKREQPADSIRMAVAAAMSKSNREIPHYYLETKVDMRHLIDWLASENKKRTVKNRLLPAAVLLKAVAKALAIVPELNAYWENGLQLKNEINIGFVVSLHKGGVMIPAILDVAHKSIDEIMALLSDIIPRARNLKLRSSELSASTITVTSLGEGSVETVFGIIYPPQVAILGFGSITEQPWAENGMLDVRPVMHITLSADHRATDGQTGSRFLNELKQQLLKPEEL